jgi:acetyltransferase-like isoleucine patch superfamily enzyme
MSIAEYLLRKDSIVFLIWLFEVFSNFLLTLPIPIYSTIMYRLVHSARGLPSMGGMYLRALYYRSKLGTMEANVLIDQNVFFADPKHVHLSEFSYLDKNVIIMSRSTVVGRRVHIAPNVLISGGGDFEAKDYSGISMNSNIITSTETLKHGSRSSGPMVSVFQREVMRGKVTLEKDAFIGAAATILPNTTLAEGTVVAAGAVVSGKTEPWAIYANARPKIIAHREAVIHPDD